MRQNLKAFLGPVLACVFSLLFAPPVFAQNIIGRIENVVLPELGLKLKARIDTGAGVSSIDAKIIEIKKPLVLSHPQRIVFEIKDKAGKTKRLERPIVGWQDIKHKGSVGSMRRPIVILTLCLAGKVFSGRVNLADRSEFLYPVLVGRNFLKMGEFLIDPRHKFRAKGPTCPE